MVDFLKEKVDSRIREIMIYSESQHNIFVKPARGCGSTTAISRYVFERFLYEQDGSYLAVLLFPREAMIQNWIAANAPQYFDSLGVSIKDRMHNHQIGQSRLILRSCKYDNDFLISEIFRTGIRGYNYKSTDIIVTDYTMTIEELDKKEKFAGLVREFGLMPKAKAMVEVDLV